MERRKTIMVVAGIAVLVLLGITAESIGGGLRGEGSYSKAELFALRQSALGALFREFRISLGDLLWLKGDEYIHKGIVYKEVAAELWEEKMREMEQHGEERHIHEGERVGEEGHDEAEQHFEQYMGYGEAHEHVLPSMRFGFEDFRGILGDVERAVKPFAAHHHEHSGLRELIPWFRLVTQINPHHVRAYITGAYFVQRFGDRPLEGFKFLKEGERNNPRNAQMKEAVGSYLYLKLRKPLQAVPYYKKAISMFEESEQERELDEEEELSYRDAYVNLMLACSDLKRFEEGERYGEKGLQRFAEEEPLKKAVEKLAAVRADTMKEEEQ